MEEFKCVTGEKEGVVVVLFYGKIGSPEVPALEQLCVELKDKSQALIIFNFRDVPSLLPGAHAVLAKIQKTLRTARKNIALASLKPEVREGLLMAGVVREAELFNNVPEAWNSLKDKSQAVANESQQKATKTAA